MLRSSTSWSLFTLIAAATVVAGATPAAAANSAEVLPAFAGIWVADGNEPLGLGAGCALMQRVTVQPPSLLRAVICPNGQVQTDRAKIVDIGIEPSRFPAAFQLRTRLGEVRSSCPDDVVSSLAAPAALAFDLKTAAGGDAATIAYTQFGELELALHSGGAIDTFDRNRDCASIAKVAAGLPDTEDNRLVKLAAKVCRLEAGAGGCFTASGYVSNDPN